MAKASRAQREFKATPGGPKCEWCGYQPAGWAAYGHFACTKHRDRLPGLEMAPAPPAQANLRLDS